MTLIDDAYKLGLRCSDKPWGQAKIDMIQFRDRNADPDMDSKEPQLAFLMGWSEVVVDSK